MIFYLTFIPAAVLLVLLAIKLWRLNTQARTLYRFCKLRRDIMSYLRKNYKEMSHLEYEEIEGILEPLNNTIHNFHFLKVQFFNFSRFKEVLVEIIRKTEKVENKTFEYNSAKDFQESFAVAYIKAFGELIPFFEWRLSAHLFYIIADLCFKLGYDNLMTAKIWLENKANKHHISRYHFLG